MSQGQVTVKQLITRMQNETNFPAISEHISEINCKAAPSSDSSASQLASLILRDYSLTSRMLKVSNSAMYGQFSGTICTVSRAVVVLGFEQVQLTATGLIFFEHLQDKAQSHYIKEAVLSAFLSGILARDLAKNIGLDGWENFFIGAMFHNFGRLLAMYYFPEEFAYYQELLERGEQDETRASRKALGVSFSELGIGIAKAWSLPDQIMVSMKLPDEGKLKEDVKKINHQQVLPRFANELCDLTMNVPPQARQAALERLLEKYRKIYPLRDNEIAEMMENAIKEMQSFSAALKLNRSDLQNLDKRSFNATQSAAEAPQEALEQPAKIPSLKRFEIAQPNESTQDLSVEQERKLNLRNGIQELSNAMLDEFDLDQILSMILETIYLGIGFDRVVIFFKGSDAEQMLARFGLGANTAHIIRDFSFPLDATANDLFNMALRENKDLYIGNISDTEIRDFKPSWFQGLIFCPSFALYPIVINGKQVGLIYGGHDEPGEHLDLEQLNGLKTLRNQAALAIKQSHSS
jgi:HD-like signal output (HDOD) protein